MLYELTADSLTVPEGLKFIEEEAFCGCKSLEEITIPSTVILLGKRCFEICDSLRRVLFAESLTTAADSVTTVELHEAAFGHCVELRSARLPRNLFYIPRRCFTGCIALIDVPIPVAVREIRYASFSECESLVSTDLSENINVIESKVYRGCSSLQKVTIRSSNNLRVGRSIFRSCPELSSITVFPSLWPKLFQTTYGTTVESSFIRNDYRYVPRNENLNFIYTFFKEYHYQMNRLVEWKNTDGASILPSENLHNNDTIGRVDEHDEEEVEVEGAEEEEKRQRLR